MSALQQLFPATASGAGFIKHTDAYELPKRPKLESRPWVISVMLASLDGAINVKGRSGPLGCPADFAVLLALRALADAVVVGAGTLRTEEYGPMELSAAARKRRSERGQHAFPLLAAVSSRCVLDPKAPVWLGERRNRLYVPACAPPERLEPMRAVADVRVQEQSSANPIVHESRTTLPSAANPNKPGDPANTQARPTAPDVVRPETILADLTAADCSVVLLEGGPILNAHFARAGLIDELCLTLSPKLVGGNQSILSGNELLTPQEMTLASVYTAEGMLFTRYLRADHAKALSGDASQTGGGGQGIPS